MKGTNVPINQKIEISQGFEKFVKARNQGMILRNVIDIFILGYELKMQSQLDKKHLNHNK